MYNIEYFMRMIVKQPIRTMYVYIYIKETKYMRLAVFDKKM